jgi:16S rRNA (adenine1518-N6/adenine1519-N6)-dimethyltransferase
VVFIERIAQNYKTKEIIKKHDFTLKKKYGQNFLIDTSILDKIVEASEITKEDLVIEIGPGIGSLTQSLAQNAGQVVAIEIDNKLIPVLKETLKDYNNITIINKDVLSVDIGVIIESYNYNKVKVIANLPYYITTPIVMNLLEKEYKIDKIVIMVQKEVADRMKAKANTKEYGAISLAVCYYAQTSIVTKVPPQSFMPKPNVDSAVIKLEVRKEPKVKVSNKALMFKIIKCAFGQRRKTLVNCLFKANFFGISKEELAKTLEQCGLDKNIRGEVLDLEDYAKVTEALLSKM